MSAEACDAILLEMEMNSFGHTTQHFNCVQEEWANKKAIIFILKVKKANKSQLFVKRQGHSKHHFFRC